MCDKHCVMRPDCRVCTPVVVTFTAEQLKAHGPVIMAWLGGATIQMKFSQPPEGWFTYNGAYAPDFDPKFIYRVKPEPVKCAPYRRYIVKESAGHYTYVYRPNHGTVADVEGCKNFVRWVDKEWQYEEV